MLIGRFPGILNWKSSPADSAMSRKIAGGGALSAALLAVGIARSHPAVMTDAAQTRRSLRLLNTRRLQLLYLALRRFHFKPSYDHLFILDHGVSRNPVLYVPTRESKSMLGIVGFCVDLGVILPDLLRLVVDLLVPGHRLDGLLLISHLSIRTSHQKQ